MMISRIPPSGFIKNLPGFQDINEFSIEALVSKQRVDCFEFEDISV